MRHAILLSLRVLSAGLALLAAAGWAGWAVGQVLTDRFGWSQWLHWIASPFAVGLALILFASMRIAWPRRRPITAGMADASHTAATPGTAPGTTSGATPGAMSGAAHPRRRRSGPLRRTAAALTWVILLGTIGRFAFVEHRLLASAPADPEGLVILHWTIGESSKVPYPDIADQIVGRNPDIAILTDAPWIRVETAMLEWIRASEHGRRLRFRPFEIFTRLPIREARQIISTPDLRLVRLVLLAPEMSDGQLEIAIVDLPSDPATPRHQIADVAVELIRSVEVGDVDLVIGDFNMHRGSASMRRIVAELMPSSHLGGVPFRHAFNEGGAGYAATWSQRLPLWHIDHVWMADRVRCTRYETPLAAGYRHYPQIAWIAPRTPSSPR